MSLQLPTILSPPTRCIPVPALTVLPQVRPRSCRTPFPGRLPSWASPFPPQARQCIWPNRVHHFLNYGLVVRFRLLSTPPLGGAVAFCYGQPVLLSDGDFHPAVGAHLSGAHRGRDEGKLRPSLRTGQANFSHPALQSVVTLQKIDEPQRALALRSTSPWW